MKRVLVIEDDQAIRRGLVDALRYTGYHPVEAANGEAGLQKAINTDIDLVLLDVLMPKKDGFAVLEELRRVKPTLPIIMLTAKGTEEDRVRGLQNGADDYVVKPFSAKEVLARVEAVLRRSAERPQAISNLVIDDCTIDFARREAKTHAGKCIELTEKEAAVLHYLAANDGRVIDRQELLAKVWGLNPDGVHTRTVDMLIARLRERLEKDPAKPKIILTVRSKGYKLGEITSKL